MDDRHGAEARAALTTALRHKERCPARRRVALLVRGKEEGGDVCDRATLRSPAGASDSSPTGGVSSVSGYHVKLVDGPAKGWDYFTAVEPEAPIEVATNPLAALTEDTGFATPGGDWMRVLHGTDPPWPGHCTYTDGSLAAVQLLGRLRGRFGGDVIVNYRHQR
jgi:hypothetical protein